MLAKFGFLHSGFHDANGFIVDPNWHGEWLSIFAPMSQGEAGWILKPVRCAVNDLGHHGKRLHGARSDTWNKQEFRKIGRPPCGCGSKGAVQSPEYHVAWPYVMMRWHY